MPSTHLDAPLKVSPGYEKNKTVALSLFSIFSEKAWTIHAGLSKV